jgi:divalent metal cation (Fe/Co/Zn/Cd) transporter
MKALLVGRSAEPDIVAVIEKTIAEDGAIERLYNAITLHLGPSVMLAAKVKMVPGMSVKEAVEHINALERRIKEAFPEIEWCFVEPDVTD